MIRPGLTLIKDGHILIVCDIYVSYNLETIIMIQEITKDGFKTTMGNFNVSNFMDKYGDWYVADFFVMRRLKDKVVPIQYANTRRNFSLPQG